MEVDETYSDLCKNVDWLIIDEWYREQCSVKPGWTMGDAKIEWDRLIDTQERKFKVFANVQHMRVYRGMNHREGSRDALKKTNLEEGSVAIQG